jgi:hypothetical protein
MNRPAGLGKKQWLVEHNAPEKSYYYWQRRLRQNKYDECQTENLAVVPKGNLRYGGVVCCM